MADPMPGLRARSARIRGCPDESTSTTAQLGAGSQTAARSTMNVAIAVGSSVELTARMMSSRASRCSTRLRSAWCDLRSRVDRSRSGAARESSVVRAVGFRGDFPR
jgi:hypothetical protein